MESIASKKLLHALPYRRNARLWLWGIIPEESACLAGTGHKYIYIIYIYIICISTYIYIYIYTYVVDVMHAVHFLVDVIMLDGMLRSSMFTYPNRSAQREAASNQQSKTIPKQQAQMLETVKQTSTQLMHHNIPKQKLGACKRRKLRVSHAHSPGPAGLPKQPGRLATDPMSSSATNARKQQVQAVCPTSLWHRSEQNSSAMLFRH